MNISALDLKMSIKHVHDIYERVCEFGGKMGGSIQLSEAANGDDFGRQIVAIAIHYVRSKTKVKPQPLHWLPLDVVLEGISLCLLQCDILPWAPSSAQCCTIICG